MEKNEPGDVVSKSILKKWVIYPLSREQQHPVAHDGTKKCPVFYVSKSQQINLSFSGEYYIKKCKNAAGTAFFLLLAAQTLFNSFRQKNESAMIR